MPTVEPYLVLNNTTARPRSSFPLSDDKKYNVAKVAREKLMVESSFRDHDLRRLVGHANLVDKFIEEYAPRAPYYSFTSIETVEKTSGERHEHYVLQAEKITITPASKPQICTVSRAVSMAPCTEVSIEECEVSEDED